MRNNNIFNWQIYINNYQDLCDAGINTADKAYRHWIKYGKNEGRIANRSIYINIKINLGIGDILIYIYIYHQAGLLDSVQFIIDTSHAMIYRNNYLNYLEFIKKLLKKYHVRYKLIDKNNVLYRTPFTVTESLINLNDTNFQTSLSSFRQLSYLKNNIFPQEYIIIHTKLRTNILTKHFKKDEFSNYITNLFTNFRSKVPIVLLGEKEIVGAYENKIISMHSLYKELVNSLQNNNKVIDLTVNNVQKDHDFNLFERDISIIHHAECNIVFGEGGNLVMSILFGKKYIALVTHYHHAIFDRSFHGVICKTYETMSKEVFKLTGQ